MHFPSDDSDDSSEAVDTFAKPQPSVFGPPEGVENVRDFPLQAPVEKASFEPATQAFGFGHHETEKPSAHVEYSSTHDAQYSYEESKQASPILPAAASYDVKNYELSKSEIESVRSRVIHDYDFSITFEEFIGACGRLTPATTPAPADTDGDTYMADAHLAADAYELQPDESLSDLSWFRFWVTPPLSTDTATDAAADADATPTRARRRRARHKTKFAQYVAEQIECSLDVGDAAPESWHRTVAGAVNALCVGVPTLLVQGIDAVSADDAALEAECRKIRGQMMSPVMLAVMASVKPFEDDRVAPTESAPLLTAECVCALIRCLGTHRNADTWEQLLRLASGTWQQCGDDSAWKRRLVCSVCEAVALMADFFAAAGRVAALHHRGVWALGVVERMVQVARVKANPPAWMQIETKYDGDCSAHVKENNLVPFDVIRSVCKMLTAVDSVLTRASTFLSTIAGHWHVSESSSAQPLGVTAFVDVISPFVLGVTRPVAHEECSREISAATSGEWSESSVEEIVVISVPKPQLFAFAVNLFGECIGRSVAQVQRSLGQSLSVEMLVFLLDCVDVFDCDEAETEIATETEALFCAVMGSFLIGATALLPTAVAPGADCEELVFAAIVKVQALDGVDGRANLLSALASLYTRTIERTCDEKEVFVLMNVLCCFGGADDTWEEATVSALQGAVERVDKECREHRRFAAAEKNFNEKFRDDLF